MRKLITIITFAIISVSCNKSDKKHSSVSKINTDNSLKKSLKLEFIYRTNKSDVFKIMMNNIEVDELQKKHIHISENVEPSSNDDYIIAKFDPDNLSKQIVISLGNNNEKEVIIKSIIVSYGDKQFNLISPEDLNSNLVFNKFIIRDSTSNVISTKRIQGKLNPTIRLKNSLINQLERE